MSQRTYISFSHCAAPDADLGSSEQCAPICARSPRATILAAPLARLAFRLELPRERSSADVSCSSSPMAIARQPTNSPGLAAAPNRVNWSERSELDTVGFMPFSMALREPIGKQRLLNLDHLAPQRRCAWCAKLTSYVHCLAGGPPQLFWLRVQVSEVTRKYSGVKRCVVRSKLQANSLRVWAPKMSLNST